MKSILLAISFFTASFAFAAISPLKYVEKSSYKLSALVKQGGADKSFLMDTYRVTLTANNGNMDITLFSSSADEKEPNTLTITLDKTAKFVNSSTHFTRSNPSKTVFTKANADTVLDLGSEYIVDHLKDSPEIVFVAEHAKEVLFVNDSGKINMNILLDDGRTYRVIMDIDGNLISKGMLP